jgi:hypothetical protein
MLLPAVATRAPRPKRNDDPTPLRFDATGALDHPPATGAAAASTRGVPWMNQRAAQPNEPDAVHVSVEGFRSLTELGRQKLCTVTEEYALELVATARETRVEIGAEDIENALALRRLRGPRATAKAPDGMSIVLRVSALLTAPVGGLFGELYINASSRWWALPSCIGLLLAAAAATLWDLVRSRRRP